jgi:hypothetical protein
MAVPLHRAAGGNGRHGRHRGSCPVRRTAPRRSRARASRTRPHRHRRHDLPARSRYRAGHRRRRCVQQRPPVPRRLRRRGTPFPGSGRSMRSSSSARARLSPGTKIPRLATSPRSSPRPAATSATSRQGSQPPRLRLSCTATCASATRGGSTRAPCGDRRARQNNSRATMPGLLTAASSVSACTG